MDRRRSNLVDGIAEAARLAVTDLFGNHPTHHFYYCSLITTGEGHSPRVSAWSWEALAEAVRRSPDDDSAAEELKWSYADSPFYCYGEHHFEAVDRLFETRDLQVGSSYAARMAEVEARLGAMEAAMARLDEEAIFGTGSERDRIVINVEVMPPDHTNVERALRLNRPDALVAWLAEAAEADLE